MDTGALNIDKLRKAWRLVDPDPWIRVAAKFEMLPEVGDLLILPESIRKDMERRFPDLPNWVKFSPVIESEGYVMRPSIVGLSFETREKSSDE